MKKILHQLHLWLGLVSGLLVFIIAITGALYAFQEEFSNLGKYKYVEIQPKEYLLPTDLEKIAEKTLPGKELHGIKYNTAGKATEAIFMDIILRTTTLFTSILTQAKYSR